MTIPTHFRLLREACRLSREDMAIALDVRPDTLRAWDSGQRNPPASVLAEARALYQLIFRASGALGALIDSIKRRSDLILGLAASDTAAKKLGFPVMAAQHAAVAMAIAALRDDVAVELVPWREGIETARAQQDPPNMRGGFQTQAGEPRSGR